MKLGPLTYVATIQALARWSLDAPGPSPRDTFIALRYENSHLYGVASFSPVEGAGYLEFKSFWVEPDTEAHYLVPFWYELNEMDALTRKDPKFSEPPEF